jgi:hypothetical protein
MRAGTQQRRVGVPQLMQMQSIEIGVRISRPGSYARMAVVIAALCALGGVLAIRR